MFNVCGSAAIPFLVAIRSYGLQPEAHTAIRLPDALQRITVEIRLAVVGSSEIERSHNQAVVRNRKRQRPSKCANDTSQSSSGDARIEPVLLSLYTDRFEDDTVSHYAVPEC